MSIMARNAADIFSAELSRIIRIPAKPPKDPPKGDFQLYLASWKIK